jgi:hypothetical protein
LDRQEVPSYPIGGPGASGSSRNLTLSALSSSVAPKLGVTVLRVAMATIGRASAAPDKHAKARQNKQQSTHGTLHKRNGRQFCSRAAPLGNTAK